MNLNEIRRILDTHDWQWYGSSTHKCTKCGAFCYHLTLTRNFFDDLEMSQCSAGPSLRVNDKEADFLTCEQVRSTCF